MVFEDWTCGSVCRYDVEGKWKARCIETVRKGNGHLYVFSPKVQTWNLLHMHRQNSTPFIIFQILISLDES
jgi:hypothetical protein